MKAERNQTFVKALGRRSPLALVVLMLAAVVTTGCRQDMHDQAKYEPLEASDLFPNGMASRPRVANTVARGQLHEDAGYYTGKAESGEFVASFPLAQLRKAVEEERWRITAPESESGFTRAILKRGEQRFGMFCVHCHGKLGAGNGMIVQRGFKQPESYHSERLRASAPGYFVNVMTEGFGQMSSYAHQVKVEDRWAIAAYIQALQLSQAARDADLSPEDRHEIEKEAAGGDSPDPGGHGADDDHGAAAHSGAK